MLKKMNIGIIITYTFLATTTNCCRCLTLEDTHNLFGNLSSNYDIRVRPVKNQNDAVYVNISFHIMSVQDFNDITGTVFFQSFIYMQWRDERMKWRPENYGNLSTISLPLSDLWWPKPTMINSPDHRFQPCQSAERARVSHTGEIFLVAVDTLEALCPVDISLYPFDIQTCMMSIITSGYSVKEVSFVISNVTEVGGAQTLFLENSAWVVHSSEVTVENISLTSALQAKLKLKRRHLYTIVNLIVPIFTLAFLNTWVFILPPESGERTSFSITVLLSFVVYMSILSDNVPKGSEPLSNLSLLIMTMIFYSVSLLFWTILSLRLYNNENKKPVPVIIQTCTRFARFRYCRRFCKWNVISVKSKSGRNFDEQSETNSELKQSRLMSISENFRDEAPSEGSKTGVHPGQVTWTMVAESVDTYAYIVHVCWWIYMIVLIVNLSS